VFALTRKTGFFLKLGFQVVPRDSLPRKIWKDCITCTKFVGCDEVAVVREVEKLDGWMAGWLEEWKNGRMKFDPVFRPSSEAPPWGNHPAIQPSNHPAFHPSNNRGKRP
jgi:hypothetical protein